MLTDPTTPINPLVPPDEDRLRQAILDRDRALDGRVSYGVRTTGVYCRPSCPARRPRREHVVFLPSRDAAEGAGFRPCRRCRPREIDAQTAFVLAACRAIDAEPDATLTLAELGRRLGVSPAHLQASDA